MTLLTELYNTKINLAQVEEELDELKKEYNDYRTIMETGINNKRVKDIKDHITWYNREQLTKKAKEVLEEEWQENCLLRARDQERKRRRSQREEEEKEKKKRAAERKALDQLMEKERRERSRKNQEAN